MEHPTKEQAKHLKRRIDSVLQEEAAIYVDYLIGEANLIIIKSPDKFLQSVLLNFVATSMWNGKLILVDKIRE